MDHSIYTDYMDEMNFLESLRLFIIKSKQKHHQKTDIRFLFPEPTKEASDTGSIVIDEPDKGDYHFHATPLSAKR